MQHLAEHVDITFEGRGSGAIGPPLFNLNVGQRADGLTHGCTIATTYRASRLPVLWKRVGPARTYRRQSPARSRKSEPSASRVNDPSSIQRRCSTPAMGDASNDTEAPPGIG